MANIRWPAEEFIPQSMPISTTIEQQQSFIETPMDHGAARRRARFSSILRMLKGPSHGFMFYGNQKVNLDTFYYDEIAGGALGFNWNEPVLGIGDVVVQFMEPPGYRLVAPNSTVAEQLWGVTIKLIVLPMGHPGYIANG